MQNINQKNFLGVLFILKKFEKNKIWQVALTKNYFKSLLKIQKKKKTLDFNFKEGILIFLGNFFNISRSIIETNLKETR